MKSRRHISEDCCEVVNLYFLSQIFNELQVRQETGDYMTKIKLVEEYKGTQWGTKVKEQRFECSLTISS